MIKKGLIIFALILTATHYTKAAQSKTKTKKGTKATSQKTVTKNQTSPMLYEIKKGKHKAYLLGTIHYGINFSSYPPFIRQFASKSETLVFETDIMEAQQLIVLQKQKDAKMNSSLKAHLNEKQWTTLFKAVKPFIGDNEDAVDKLSPEEATMAFTFSLLPQTEEPIDMSLYVLAKAKGKNLLFFEKPEQQMDLLKITSNLTSLKKQLDIPLPETKKSIQEMISIYKSGNDQKLGEFIVKAQTKDPASQNINKEIFDKRNAKWVKKFKDIFNTPGTEFIAVGAGHLPGENGLIQLLRKEGYQVIKYNPYSKPKPSSSSQ